MPRTWGERVDAGEPISAVYKAMMDFMAARGLTPVRSLVEAEFDWPSGGKGVLAVNGTLAPAQWRSFTLDPFHIGVYVNGWPAGIVGLFDGTLVGRNTEDMLIAALNASAGADRPLAHEGGHRCLASSTSTRSTTGSPRS